MYLDELVEEIYEKYPEVEAIANGHNVGFSDQLNNLPAEITAMVQKQIRAEYGDVLELVHGSDVELAADIDWRENTSFTDEFDIEFAGEDGWIITAMVPVERIKFYLPGENEFVISAGRLDCEVDTVKNYFGL